MLGLGCPCQVFLILGLPRTDHADAQPPTVTDKDTVTEQPLGPVPAFPDVLVGKLHLAQGGHTNGGFKYPDKSPEHAQTVLSPCKSQAISLTSRRSKARNEVRCPLQIHFRSPPPLAERCVTLKRPSLHSDPQISA